MGHLRKARARLLPSPLLGTVLPAVLGLLRQDCCWGPWQIAGPGNGSVEDKNRFSWFYDILCWDRHMSPTHPFFSQLSLRIRTSTGAHLFPAVLVSTCAACMCKEPWRLSWRSMCHACFILFLGNTFGSIARVCLSMCWCLIFYKGYILVPAPRLLSPLQDPRPPTPELPDQFIEEHVETPSHQEAPLPDTVLGGRGVTVVHSQASVSPLDSGTNRVFCSAVR
jgi:hypothetical protein